MNYTLLFNMLNLALGYVVAWALFLLIRKLRT